MSELGTSFFEIRNPFTPNPAFNQPENNFIEKAISDGIDKGLSSIGDRIGDKILHSGQMRLDGFLINLPQFVTLALVCYFVYIGYKTFLKSEMQDLSKLFPITMCYIIFKLFFKVVLHI